MRPKLDELLLVLSNLQPDLLCLTETWLTPEVNSNLVYINGFTLFRNDRIRRKGGGTAIYVRDDLLSKPIVTHDRLNNEAEGTLVDLPALNLSIFCIYIPPNLKSNTLNAIREDVTNITDDHLMCHPNRGLMLLGDFNDFDVKTLSLDLSLTDIVDRPTRGKNILDHVLISESLTQHYERSDVSYECPIGKSDHYTLVITPKRCLQKFNNCRLHTVYDYRFSNLQTLMHNAELIDWSYFTNENVDVNQKWKELYLCILSLIKSSIPQDTVPLTSRDKCWMTPLTKLLINKKWSAFRSKDWNLYNHLKLKVKEEVKKAKLLWTQKLKQSSIKGVWNVTNQLSGKKQKNHLQSLLTQYNSPKSLAEAIASTIKSDNCR